MKLTIKNLTVKQAAWIVNTVGLSEYKNEFAGKVGKDINGRVNYIQVVGKIESQILDQLEGTSFYSEYAALRKPMFIPEWACLDKPIFPYGQKRKGNL